MLHPLLLFWGLVCIGWIAACNNSSELGRATQAARVSPTELSFSEIYVGAHDEQSFSVHNEGSTRIRIDSITASGPEVVFVQQANNLFDPWVAPHTTRDFNVRFVPQASGAYEGVIAVALNIENFEIPYAATALEPLPCLPKTCQWVEFDPVAGECAYTNRTGPCDDGNACTHSSQCVGGVCLGEAVTCDEGDACSLGVCDPASGCLYLDDSQRCNDNNPCTVDTCHPEHGCQHSPLAEGIPCGAADCVMRAVCRSGLCVDESTPNGVACNDGSACTQHDACQDGECVGTPIDCNDGIACTVDSCMPSQGCVHAPTDALCDDDDPCTLDSCVAGAGCVNEQAPNFYPCGPFDCETAPLCIAGTCTEFSPPDGTPCDDGNRCTENDQCHAGECVGVEVERPPRIAQHTALASLETVRANHMQRDDSQYVALDNGLLVGWSNGATHVLRDQGAAIDLLTVHDDISTRGRMVAVPGGRLAVLDEHGVRLYSLGAAGEMTLLGVANGDLGIVAHTMHYGSAHHFGQRIYSCESRASEISVIDISNPSEPSIFSTGIPVDATSATSSVGVHHRYRVLGCGIDGERAELIVLRPDYEGFDVYDLLADPNAPSLTRSVAISLSFLPAVPVAYGTRFVLLRHFAALGSGEHVLVDTVLGANISVEIESLQTFSNSGLRKARLLTWDGQSTTLFRVMVDGSLAPLGELDGRWAFMSEHLLVRTFPPAFQRFAPDRLTVEPVDVAPNIAMLAGVTSVGDRQVAFHGDPANFSSSIPTVAASRWMGELATAPSGAPHLSAPQECAATNWLTADGVGRTIERWSRHLAAAGRDVQAEFTQGSCAPVTATLEDEFGAVLLEDAWWQGWGYPVTHVIEGSVLYVLDGAANKLYGFALSDLQTSASVPPTSVHTLPAPLEYSQWQRVSVVDDASPIILLTAGAGREQLWGRLVDNTQVEVLGQRAAADGLRFYAEGALVVVNDGTLTAIRMQATDWSSCTLVVFAADIHIPDSGVIDSIERPEAATACRILGFDGRYALVQRVSFDYPPHPTLLSHMEHGLEWVDTVTHAWLVEDAVILRKGTHLGDSMVQVDDMLLYANSNEIAVIEPACPPRLDLHHLRLRGF